MRPKQLAALAASIVTVVAGCAVAFHPQPEAKSTAVATAVPPPRLEITRNNSASAPRATLMVPQDLLNAMKQGTLQVSFHGNGRDRLTVVARNRGTEPARFQVAEGLAFQSGHNVVVTIHPQDIVVAVGRTVEQAVSTVALSSSNLQAEIDYGYVSLDLSPYRALIEYFAAHPEISDGAAQTAMLALSENLPLRAFAQFACKGSDLASRYDTSAFKVDTVDLVDALMILREIGVPDDRLALTIDPQLRIEAMIDPLAHADAMRYYGITAQTEWDYWKNELTKGDPSTRHYALYGIARFFPDVALQMLPAWARETKTSPILRLAAVQALAETQRPEAIPVLRSLVFDLGPTTELGKTAHIAAEYLDGQVGHPGERPAVVAFHNSVGPEAR
jgi:hypothetical protein